MDDPRFKHLASDPRFKAIPKKSRKVTIDSRFQSMFTDDKFKVKYKVDKRGRKVKQTSSEDLRKYYELEDGGTAEKEERKMKGKKGKVSGGEAVGRQSVETSSRNKRQAASESLSSGGDSEGDSESESEVGGESEASSTDLGEGEEEEEEEAPAHYIGGIGELTEEAVSAPLSDDTSCRLAVVNMDWDHVGARDIFVLLNSFKPAGASILSVNVYPSDFGLERMAKEDIEGPAPLSPSSEGESCVRGKDQSGEGEEYSKEKLRKYQLSRFKYYYAVVECDSEGTAEHIYMQCNGLEYEHSGGQLDLRFIPDEMTFDDREPASTATEGSATADFMPADFVSSALQQSKVKLTWDETDPHRVKVTQRKFTKDDLQSMDFSAYLASSSSEGEGEESAEEGEGEEGGSHTRKALKYKVLL